MDKILNVDEQKEQEYIGGLIKKVSAAQKKFATFTQEQVDEIFRRVALKASSMRIPLAKMAVEETGMVVEGIKACKAFYELKEELGIEMPITDALYQVLFNGKNAKEMVNMLLQRDKKSETY